jgi:hypothetical protein
MKSPLKGYGLLASLAVVSTLVGACSSPSGPTDTTGTVSLTLLRNGQPVVGLQTILQNEVDNTEIGSGVSDASGKITSTTFTGTARATFVDGYTGTSALLTLQDLKAGSSLNINLPILNPTAVGSVSFTNPTAFPGADNYQVYALTSTNQDSVYLNAPPAAGNTTLSINQDAVLPNGNITLVAVAGTTSSAGVVTPVAYSVLANAAYTPSPATPSSILTFPAWQSNFTDVSMSIAAVPAGFNVSTGNVTLRQFVKNTYLSQNPFTQPSNYSATPLNYSMSVIPGLSDEYQFIATIVDATDKSLLGMIRQSQVLPSLSSWNPTASGLPLSTKMLLDPAAPAAAPRLTWTQSGSATGISQAALAALEWTSGGTTFLWYTVFDSETVDTTHAYQFPTLPAAYAAYVPPSGVSFEQALMLYASYSGSGAGFTAVTDYDSFVSAYNLSLLGFQLPQQSNSQIDLSGVDGTP